MGQRGLRVILPLSLSLYFLTLPLPLPPYPTSSPYLQARFKEAAFLRTWVYSAIVEDPLTLLLPLHLLLGPCLHLPYPYAYAYVAYAACA